MNPSFFLLLTILLFDFIAATSNAATEHPVFKRPKNPPVTKRPKNPPVTKRPVFGPKATSKLPTRKPTLSPFQNPSYIQVSSYGSTDLTCSTTPEYVNIIKAGACIQSKQVTTNVNHYIKYTFNLDINGKAEVKLTTYSDNLCSILTSTVSISGGYTITPGTCISMGSSNIMLSLTNGNIPTTYKYLPTIRGYTDSTSCTSATAKPSRIQLIPSNHCIFDSNTNTYESWTCTSASIQHSRWTDSACTIPTSSPNPLSGTITTGKYCSSLDTSMGFIDEQSYFYGTASCENII